MTIKCPLYKVCAYTEVTEPTIESKPKLIKEYPTHLQKTVREMEEKLEQPLQYHYRCSALHDGEDCLFLEL